jgi:hypothetical protein
MKRWFILGCLAAMMLAQSAFSQAPIYVNDSALVVPPEVAPQVDALTFVNNGLITIAFTNFDFLPLFDTTRTLNFTNHGVMTCNTGFRFDTEPAESGVRKQALTFYNDGEIDPGTGTNDIFSVPVNFFGGALGLFSLNIGGARTYINAASIVNPGTINSGFDSLIKMTGDTIDLTRTLITMQDTGVTGTAGRFFFNQGFLDGYWGTGTNVITPDFQFATPPAVSPPSLVTNRFGFTQFQQLGGPDFISYLSDETDNSGSNRLVRAVFLRNTNSAYDATVYLPRFGPVEVQLEAVITNLLGEVITNDIYVFDTYGVLTNAGSVINGTAGGRPTYMPRNYTIFTGFHLDLGTPEAPAAVPFGEFDFLSTTNQYAAYEALFSSTSISVSDVVGQNVTNLPGRIEIDAAVSLDLTLARIQSENYLLLQSTNQYLGNSNAIVQSPVVDLNLRSKTGTLAITNLIPLVLPKPEGTIELYSARWTNLISGVTNTYHVMFLDAQLSPVSPPREQTVVLSSTGGADNLLLSDVFHITGSALFDAARITITSNGPNAATPSGGLIFENNSILWSTITPRLMYFTNNGFYLASNSVFFGNSRGTPYAPQGFNTPYFEFINTGVISNFASLIWAVDFQESGPVFASGGSIELYNNHTAFMTNAGFFAPGGDIRITSDYNVVSNFTLQAGSDLTFSVSSYLDDGSLATGSADLVTNKNTWYDGNGFNLLIDPTHASLLATTVSNSAVAYRKVINRWAAKDLGCVPQGFVDNAAVGHLILDGGTNSLFEFTGTSSDNALYVDQLDLRDFTATTDARGRFVGIQVDPNMHIYYADATANGVEVSEKLQTDPSGRFCWVAGYNCGFFSSTNMVYPDGSTNRVNRALAQSCTIDSNGDRIVNCADPAPIPPSQAGCNQATPIIVPPAAAPASSAGGSTGSGAGAGAGNSIAKLDRPGTQSGSGAVMPNAFLATKGVYSGLFYATNGVAANNSGSFSATTTGNGGYSGRLSLGGKTYGFSGHFDFHGKNRQAVARKGAAPLILTLNLDLTGEDQITGTVSDGIFTAEIFADRQVYTKSNPAPEEGTYTLVIPPDDSSAAGPQGSGVGTVKVDKLGNVAWTGSLADGSAVSQKSLISKQGVWPLYSSLYSGAGSILSWIQFNPASSSLSGHLVWSKPGGAPLKTFSGSFTNDVIALGSAYHKTGMDIGPFSRLILSGGGLGQAITNGITLGTNNKLSAGPGANRFSLGATGAFTGRALDPQTGRTLTFQGVLFDNGQAGVGYFLNSGQSGGVLLAP